MNLDDVASQWLQNHYNGMRAIIDCVVDLNPELYELERDKNKKEAHNTI